MATHSSILAWEIPWTEEWGRLQFTGSQRVTHDWVTNTIKNHTLRRQCNVNPNYWAPAVRDGESNGTPLQYSCLENPWTEEPGRLQSMGSLRVGHDWATSPSFHFHALEKEMATHSSVLAWRIPGTGEPGGPPSMGSHRVGHDWSALAAAAAVIH